MTPEEFTKTQKVNVIYDPNGQYILDKHVYELMQRHADQQLILSGVSVSFSKDDMKKCADFWNGKYIEQKYFDQYLNER